MRMHDQFESIAALDAIGAATADEASDFRAHGASCPECRRVRDEYEEALSLLARDIDHVESDDGLAARTVGIGVGLERGHINHGEVGFEPV